MPTLTEIGDCCVGRETGDLWEKGGMRIVGYWVLCRKGKRGAGIGNRVGWEEMGGGGIRGGGASNRRHHASKHRCSI